jgi:hypothetical protein
VVDNRRDDEATSVRSEIRLTNHVDYECIAAGYSLAVDAWDAFVRERLAHEWIGAYKAMSTWMPEVLEITQGALVFLFDAAPTLKPVTDLPADDRVVAVWGHSQKAAKPRDRARLAGFLPTPSAWSRARLDRGHLVAHAAGGGLDLNLFPQAMNLNRGRSAQGRVWRKMEAYLARNPGTPLFVRPIYGGPSWRPAALDYGVLNGAELWSERFVNCL